MNVKEDTSDRVPAGLALERKVSEMLKLIPGAEVQHQVVITGKKVDTLCVLPHPFFPRFRIAVECKDWNRPLTRERCAGIIADYYPLLDQQKIDQFLLVTRNGVVAGAKKLFDARRLHQMSFADLADKIFDPGPLIDNMRRQYASDQLNEYYIEQTAYAPEAALARRRFDLLYNDFIDFAVELQLSSLARAVYEWKHTGGELPTAARKYTVRTFERCYHERRFPERVWLDHYVMDWVRDNRTQLGLAVLGSYGTGKSSFARHLTFLCAEAYSNGELDRIPFLIELKEFGSHQDIGGLITHELVNKHGVANGAFELFQSLNAAGRFLLILDGFDEMKQGMTADSLLYNFDQIGSLNVGAAKVLLCGRPTIFESQAEQNRVLKGELAIGNTRNARYIQVTIAPFEIQDVCTFLECYSSVKDPENTSAVRRFTRELVNECKNNSELAQLVSRPVHLPMLATVIPLTRLRPRNVRRSSLYSQFITAIIQREMLKRPAEFQRLYSAAARLQFARELAVEICRKGDSRSIRTSEIPESLIMSFAPEGYSVEAVRRDLVGACFLDRKPPDILFVPHKSFLEFLAAEYIAELLKADHQDLAEAGFPITPEICSFAVDLIREFDWVRLWRNAVAHTTLLTMWIYHLRDRNECIPPAVEAEWKSLELNLPEPLLRRLVDYYETAAVVSHEAVALLMKCVSHDSSVISVHAFRALARTKASLGFEQLAAQIGDGKMAEWLSHGWLKPDESDASNLRAVMRGIFLRLLLAHSSRALDVLGARRDALRR